MDSKQTNSNVLFVLSFKFKTIWIARRNYEMKKMKMYNKGMSADEDNEDD
jgi:hypothetical protein